jgi:hypothetical protein
MKKRYVVLSSLVVVFALFVIANAQPQANSDTTKSTASSTQHKVKHPLMTTKGEISSIDINGRTLTLMEGQNPMSFNFNDKTRVTQSGRSVQASAIKTGERASIKYKEQDGQKWATAIQLASAKKETTKR